MSLSLPPDQLNALWNEFLERWPLERLSDMQLSDYTGVGNDDSFCYWLESRTNDLGSIWGGSSFKFGVFRRKDKTHKESRLGRSYTSDFAWLNKYGNTPDEAFSSVLEQIVTVALSARAGDLEAIDQADLGEAVRWKIAFLYQDRNDLNIAPIYISQLLREITDQSRISPAQAQRALMADRNNKEVFEYAGELLEIASAKMAEKLSTEKALEYLNNSTYYSPIKPPSDKIAGFQSQSGLQLALVLSNAKVTLFLEPGDWQETAKGLYAVSKIYSAPDSRNSNLSSNAPNLFTGHPAICVTVESLKNLSELCDIYESSEGNITMAIQTSETASTSQPNAEALNTILYGPPGTGKTYATTEMAVKLADPQWYTGMMGKSLDESTQRKEIKAHYDALLASGRIAFTTFHQSFSYEDFVEGIRAETEDGQIAYNVKDGIFKALALIASANADNTSPLSDSISLAGRRVWKMSLGNTLKGEEDAYQDCIGQNYIGLGWGDDIDFTSCDTRDAVLAHYSAASQHQYANTDYNISAVNTFKNVISPGDIVVVSDGNHKFRAIGEITGDYRYAPSEEGLWFNQTRKVRWLRLFEPSLPKEVLFQKALSQMTLYELKPTTLRMEKLKEFLEKPASEASRTQNHVLIIDEINRGNVSRIFGELITLLEPDKRSGGSDSRSVVLPYSKKRFSVPQNLYVLGTMNTADKSLAQIDLALRRRFEFVELQPAPTQLGDLQVHGVKIADLLDVLNQRIEVLLDRDHTIGHAYFWSLREIENTTEREAKLAEIFQKRIIPLLQEYFFSDWERIGWVLNDPAKPDAARFIKLGGSGIAVEKLFCTQIAAEIHDRRYSINPAAFSNPAAYQGILPAQATDNA